MPDSSLQALGERPEEINNDCFDLISVGRKFP